MDYPIDLKVSVAGFTLVEFLVTVVIISLTVAGVMGFYVSQRRVIYEQELSATLEANLRLGMEKLAYAIRNAGYGVPTSNLTSWFPWVSGFDNNPKVTQGAGSAPDTLAVASCTSQPIAQLSADAAIGATNLSLNSTTGLDTTSRRLIFIGDTESALVQTVSGTTITIDTNPVLAGAQGLTRAYRSGIPICRVDVPTFAVDATNRRLTRNNNQGNGAQPAVDGINDLQITVITSGTRREYELTLTARSSTVDPTTGNYPERNLNSKVSLRN